MAYRSAEEILEVIMDDDTPEENLHFLRQHLLLAAQRACTLALQWGEDGMPDPKMASRAGKIWDLAEDICPPQEDWGGENVIRFPYEKVRAG